MNNFVKNIFSMLLAVLIVTPAIASKTENMTDKGVCVSLFDQLLTLNKEWLIQPDIKAQYLDVCLPVLEHSQLIEVHLELVHETLAARSTAHLSAQQQGNRAAGLKALRQYHQNGIFPVNPDYKVYIPYFIDAHETACAVGHIMQESGARALAQRIADTQNNAYLREISQDGLIEWQIESGFTVDELAWIQPSYAPCWNTPWLNNTVSVPDCGESDGSIDITLDNPSILAFQWEDGSSATQRTNLTTGLYCVDILYYDDAYNTNCQGVQCIEIENTDGPEVSMNTESATCSEPNGSAVATVNSGMGPFTYEWFDGSTNANITGLEANSSFPLSDDPYWVKISDGNNCSTVETFYISTTNNLSVSVNTIVNAGCQFYDGAIDITVNNGTPPYQFNWSDGSSNEDLIGVGPGFYQLEVLDAYGCVGNYFGTVEYECNSSYVLVDDTASTDGQTVTISPLCNDFVSSGSSDPYELFQGKWKLVYLSGGFAGLDPFPAYENSTTNLEFIGDSLLIESEYWGYLGDGDYAGIYTYYQGANYFNELELQDPSPLFDNTAAVFELSDSVLVMSDAQVVDGFTLHFFPYDEITWFNIIEPPVNGVVNGNPDGTIDYTPNPGFSGTEIITYESCDANGICTEATITITVSDSGSGNNAPIAENDFYQGIGNYYSFTFNPVLNDTDPDGDDLTIDNYNAPPCGDLTFDPASQQFTFTFVDPNVNYCTFDYTVCDPLGLCDSAEVVLEYYCYPWDAIVEYQYSTVPSDLTSVIDPEFECGQGIDPAIQYVEVGSAAVSNGNILYTPPAGFIGTDSIYYTSYSYSDLGCVDCGVDVILIVEVEDVMNPYGVWPGDANANGTVNQFDFLNIGLRYGNTGPPRYEIDATTFEGMDAMAWSEDFNGLNDRHVDCNGDGIINVDDILVVVDNFGLYHTEFTPNLPPLITNITPTPYPLSAVAPADTVQEGTAVELEIHLGSADIPADEVYGIVFSMTVDTALIVEDSITINHETSWMGDNLINFEKEAYDQGMIHIGVSRIDQAMISGQGKILTVGLIIEDNLDGKMAMTETIEIDFNEVLLIDHTGNPYNVSVEGTSFVIATDITDDIPIYQNDQINVYPNPVVDEMHIELVDILVEQIIISNVAGQEIIHISETEPGTQKINVSALRPGIYFIRLFADDQIYSGRILKQ